MAFARDAGDVVVFISGGCIIGAGRPND
jgi:hypothetical protein